MTNTYDDITGTTATRPATGGKGKRAVLWVLLVISGVCNVVTSSMLDINMFVGIGFGLVTLGLAAALITDHYRSRRS
jgi:protein-S-isoprenylcysteine O-methyltransferase Ste14